MGFVTAPHVVDPVYPGAVDEIVNLGNHWDQELLREYRSEIKTLTQQITATFETAYDYLRKGKAVYDQLCAASNLELDSTDLENISQEIVAKIFDGNFAQTKEFFASAITPLGLVGYGQEISSPCTTRYILDGGASGNVSRVLNQVVAAAKAKGHSLNLYYNPLEPEALEIVIIPALSIALLNSQAPGIEPKQGDVLIELLPDQEFLEPNLEKAAELEALSKEWQNMFAEAHKEIAAAKTLHNQLEEYYIRAMDFEGIDNVAKELFGEIWSMAAAKEKIDQKD